MLERLSILLGWFPDIVLRHFRIGIRYYSLEKIAEIHLEPITQFSIIIFDPLYDL